MARIAVAAALAALAVLPWRTAAQGAPAQPTQQTQPTQPAQGQSPSSPAQAGAPAQGQPPTPEDAAAQKKLEEDIARELGAQPQSGAAGPQSEPARPEPVEGRAGSPAAPSGAGAGPGAPTGSGTNPYARLLLLPDLSAIGSFAGAYDTYDVAGLSPRAGPFGPEDKPQALFEELELGLQAVVDPYARADVFVSFSPGDVSVEEAFLTTLNLPYGLQARAGRFFTPFGRINVQHPHVQDFVDEPLAHGRLVADEVLAGPGVDLAWLAPLPWYAELHLAAQSTAPEAEDAERLTGVARLLQYFSLGDATTLGVGVSGAARDDRGRAGRQVGGVDGYLRWRPPAGRSYLAIQGELFARRLTGAASPGTDTGWYAQAFWRQGAYFGFGARWDEAPAAGDAAPGTERRASVLAAWLPSEFQRLRMQLSWDRRPGGRDGLEALLGLEFGIGAHGAHPF